MPTERPSKSRGAATSGATAKVQENDAERRHACARRREHRCLVYKNANGGQAVRSSFGVRARSMSAHGNARTADRQPARNIWLTMEVRERFADRTTLYRRSAAVSRAEGKSKKTSQSKRKAFANDVVLNIKTPRSGSMTDLPLAFGLCRNIHAGACMLEANNRPETKSCIIRQGRACGTPVTTAII